MLSRAAGTILSAIPTIRGQLPTRQVQMGQEQLLRLEISL